MTDKTDSKERDAFEAHWLREGNPRNSLAKWQDADNVPPKMRGAYVMACTRDAWSAFQAGRASLTANAGSEPVALNHIACIEDGELRYMAGRKAPSYDCELYAMPGGKSAPPLYTHPSPPEGMVGGWTKAEPLIARSLGEWNEDDGPVVWWAWNGHGWAGESPWIGTPLDSDWPDYHTHWTPAPPTPTSADGVEHG